jgi:Fe2+ or Zn2+ uptake regulation protein
VPAGASTLDDALELVRQHGGRVTSSEAPDIHLSTIYRNLDDLEHLGVVVHSHFGHGPATYHLATSVHGHFVCEECGKLVEVPDTMFSGLAQEASTRFGFTIDPHHFAMLGRCADCGTG